MATGIDQVAANNFIGASVTGASFTAYTTPFKLALMTANGSDASAGTELTAGGGSYARQSLASAFGTVAAGTVTNSALTVTYTNMPANTVTGVEIWDSNGTPKRTWWGALTANKATNLGDTLSFATSSITATLT
uniref:phage tail fiber protein n=1 Tax=Pseudonocardia sp. CA-138482 TaxID=3240023 RepID=UPI003F495364